MVKESSAQRGSEMAGVTARRASVSEVDTQSLEYDTELELKLDTTNFYTANTLKPLTRLDHLRAVFSKNRRGKTVTHGLEESAGAKAHKVQSPWILPVHVLSLQRDENRHLIPKEAKCTIDTGNLQGNIVSRAFVVDVLGYSETSFQKLTKAEEEGGTGITGHKLFPSGAIYLTWYHNSSTRVFRDMRFLVSEYPMYELVIGAHSIEEENILNVPNLMGGVVFYNKKITSPELDQHRAALNGQKRLTSELRLKRADIPKDNPQYSDFTKQIEESMEKEGICEKNLNDTYKKLLKAAILTADENNNNKDAQEFRKEYKESYGEEVPAPVPKPEFPPKGKSSKDD
ncbi:hypothetical protein BP5796_12988 [Coleophoma crateriformis]|uniref:Uncharacterized protein n=1 Tax=Coleophoma crateriformis TaxID=565419 RepID=A0A3D8Q520_9HELO|nr:hypothetical protein BP5796_12988 [Coleophoma crateriformis]